VSLEPVGPAHALPTFLVVRPVRHWEVDGGVRHPGNDGGKLRTKVGGRNQRRRVPPMLRPSSATSEL
jgi:hypothetical protein